MVRSFRFLLGLVLMSTALIVLVLLAFVVSYYAYEGMLDHRMLGWVDPDTLIGWQAADPNHPNLRIINATSKEQEELLRAYENIDYPLADLRISVALSDSLTEAEGLFDVPTRRIYIRRGADYNYTLAHELGHLLDVETLSPGKQQEYSALRRLLLSDDWEGSYLKSQGWEIKPSEDFAEVFARLFNAELSSDNVRTAQGPITNPDELRRFYLGLVEVNPG